MPAPRQRVFLVDRAARVAAGERRDEATGRNETRKSTTWKEF